MEEEELRQQAMEMQQEAIIDQYLYHIETAYIRYEDQQIQMVFLSEQIQKAQSAIDILLSAYSGTGKGIDEIILLQGNILNYKKERIRALVMSNIERARIEKYINL